MRQRFSSFAAVAVGILICTAVLAVTVVSRRTAPFDAAPAAVRLKELGTASALPSGRPLAESKATAADLRRALHEAAAKLVNIQIAVVERGNSTVRQPGVAVPVIFKQIWMHDQSVQVYFGQRDDLTDDSWWKHFQPIEGSLTPANLFALPGVKFCLDLKRQDVAFADSRTLDPRNSASGQSTTLHSLSKSPEWLGDVFLPLIELDKPWLPERHNSQPVVNAIAREPLTAWRVLGEERLGQFECVKAEIDQQETVEIPLQRHEGKLSLTPSWLAWFSKSHGWMPVRVEGSARYAFDGREYRLARRDDGLANFIYEASDFVEFNDVWFPRQGHQDSYVVRGQVLKSTADRFVFDDLIDRLQEDGALLIKGELELWHGCEWRVLSIEKIDPSLNLWFEPPPGAEVVNTDTGKRFVQGDALTSAKIAAGEQAIEALIGKPAPEFPTDATWLNGQPLNWLALRGKVVILDFWAVSCGACYNDLAELGQLHENRESNGLTIIGIHSSDSEPEAITKVLVDRQLHYPICIDVSPLEGTLSWGQFSAQFAIDAIPHFVVVDASGTVVASESNRFEEALAVARKLVNPSPQP